MSARADRMLIAADKALRPIPYDLTAALSDLAVKWARRHGALMSALWLAENYIERGDTEGALKRIAAAMAKDAEHDA